MATKTKKKPAPKTKAKAPAAKPKAKDRTIQHCKKCGKTGHNQRRHKAKAVTKKPAKK